MNELTSIFGLCRRSGNLSTGFEAAKDAILSGKAKAVFAAADISDKTFKELVFFTNGKDITVQRLTEDIQTLSAAVGTKTGIVSVNDAGFAARARELYKGGHSL